ncbi:MAG: biotin/lipoate A/B protein ligase family protein [Trichodesmium sp. St18_bin1]|nr:biotin/lipoate A/B protein ligase family protein [Trichodesmium sp. St18_bin1]MDE5111330.1 biotin/lipoate A/B protein ligase family protein [Trichodesmium sp. St7_bin2_1]MDE5118237.1 biotin/lipoate A/B protein ligase family protein [Trichodesmium sp. St2_bin2_1]
MAIDKWLLHQHLQGKITPTLRFYTWQPVSISLGYHQKSYPEYWQNLTWQGTPVDIVRRPTGGRAVLHQGDLTYSLITSGLSGSRIESYKAICEFLIQGWRSLGIELSYGSAGRGYINNPNCFGTSTVADLILPNGKKFIGSAQARKQGTILQHGSMMLAPDVEFFNYVFSNETSSIVSDISTSFLSANDMGESLINKIIEVLIIAASKCFKIQLITEPLSDKEWVEIHNFANTNLC